MRTQGTSGLSRGNASVRNAKTRAVQHKRDLANRRVHHNTNDASCAYGPPGYLPWAIRPVPMHLCGGSEHSVDSGQPKYRQHPVKLPSTPWLMSDGATPIWTLFPTELRSLMPHEVTALGGRDALPMAVEQAHPRPQLHWGCFSGQSTRCCSEYPLRPLLPDTAFTELWRDKLRDIAPRRARAAAFDLHRQAVNGVRRDDPRVHNRAKASEDIRGCDCPPARSERS